MKSASLLFSAAAVTALLAAPSAMAGTVVPVGHFTSIQLEAGGHVTLHYGATQSVTIIKGSTQYTNIAMDRGETDRLLIKCNDDCPPHYDLEVDIVTPDIKGVSISGGGEIVAANGFPKQNSIGTAVEGGGMIDLRSISVERADAAVEGGGRILIHADRSLNAAVEDGGRVNYWGNPQVSSAIDGGGEVKAGS